MHPFTGKHLLLAFHECGANLDDLEAIARALREAAVASGATVLGEASSRFSPQGLTVVLVLAESHASVHTYPEHRAAFLDIFTCGTRCEPARFDEVMREHLRPSRVSVQLVAR